MRELAIRSALGATARSIALTVIAASSVGAAIGIGVGLLGARLGSTVLTPFLFGVTATDGVTYAVIFLLLGLVTLAATYLPALRASRVDIASILRGD